MSKKLARKAFWLVGFVGSNGVFLCLCVVRAQIKLRRQDNAHFLAIGAGFNTGNLAPNEIERLARSGVLCA
jgi:hypothetical protein